MTDYSWKTSLSKVLPNLIRIRGYDINELMEKLTFPGALYLLWTGEVPDAPVSKLISAIMVSSMDHGASPPSVNAARIVASTGGSHNAAIAAGVLALNKYHGAAVEDCMQMLMDFRRLKEESGRDNREVASEILARLKAKGDRAWGIGHRLHTADPRRETLFRLCRKCGVDGKYIEAVEAIANAVTERAGRPMPVNIDGCVAACLCEIGFPKTMANALFILSRSAGIAVQAREEMDTQKPMRKIHPAGFEYDGPADRSLPR
jgi:citrate synthase